MTRDLSESDWTLFRQLREVALERLCKRALEEVALVARDARRTYHERYLNVFRLLKEQDRELANAFNDPRRSRMIRQLAAMHPA
ncbi:MAG: peptide ABC transporter substrate-binding protein [Spirochaetes bacterium]|nr:peptide ABC transporter substrate-binding protein [Spirochaetota bacterium]